MEGQFGWSHELNKNLSNTFKLVFGKIKEAFGVCSRSLKIDMARVGESTPCLQCIGPA